MDFFTSTSGPDLLDVLKTSATSFFLIFVAEFGDKSQLVCMTLAARYRASPVFLGSVLAFLLLNTLAVTFGMAIASWLPEAFIAATVAILFAAFGLHALRVKEDDDTQQPAIRSHGGLLAGTFLLITFAEFGDKTQLAVVALSSTGLPMAVWIGATVALIATSAIGVWAGRTVLQRIPITLLHKAGGILFISLALFAANQAYKAM